MSVTPKGISPLIAGVLLIAFTLAVAAIVAGFLTSVTKTGTTEITTGFALQVNCTKAALDIIDATCLNSTAGVPTNSSGTANVSVAIANTGPIALTSPQFYFRSSNQRICTNSSITDTLNPGTSQVFRFNCTRANAAWNDSEVLQYVRVTMNCQSERAISVEKDNIADSCA